ncbi:MAG TPA: hypothetical protein DC006_04755 [Prevotellaceae bacterium]|nr:hypothetical protein [Prevotellaceae bacterium]HBE54952.1 hypothetical protein [Prevotellaceae bacterium]
MDKKHYDTPQMRVIDVQGGVMIAASLGLNDNLSTGEQLVKDVDLPQGPEGTDVVNRSLWDDEW